LGAELAKRLRLLAIFARGDEAWTPHGQNETEAGGGWEPFLIEQYEAGGDKVNVAKDKSRVETRQRAKEKRGKSGSLHN